MENNKKCYFFKKFNFNLGILDNVIDCCIVLLMENNKKREKSITETINKYKLCNKTVIQYNKGYKKCSKKLYKQNSCYDINDAYYNAFKYADSQDYRNILILEDDALFDHNILNSKIIKDIENLYNTTKVNLFNLGPGFNLVHPKNMLFDNYNCKQLILSVAAQAIIYSKEARKLFYNSYDNNGFRKKAIDMDMNILTYGPIYMYNKPLSYQPFVETENNSNWEILGVKTAKFLNNFQKNILNLDFDNFPIKSFKKLYRITFLLNIIFYLLMLLVIYKIITLILKKNK